MKLSFAISTSDDSSRVAAALQIVADLSQIGIAAEMKAVPFNVLLDKVVSERSYDALLIGVTGSGDPDPYPLFHSTEIADPGHNFSGYFTLPLDRALENSRRTSDEAKRLELIATVFQAVATEVPVIFLYLPRLPLRAAQRGAGSADHADHRAERPLLERRRLVREDRGAALILERYVAQPPVR